MTDNLKPYPAARHRPEPLQLPEDPRKAAALALALIRGDDSFYCAQAVEALNLRIAKLKDAGSTESIEELTVHLPILESLFVRFSSDAMSTNLPANKAALIRMALAAQTSYSRTVALIAGLKLQREGKASVAINNFDGES